VKFALIHSAKKSGCGAPPNMAMWRKKSVHIFVGEETFQGRRRQARHLRLSEPVVGGAEEHHLPVAPGLGGGPLDDPGVVLHIRVVEIDGVRPRPSGPFRGA
jgi:hypothetical protein